MRLSSRNASENINNSNKKVPSTPALLFYKPQKQNEDPYCDNHRNRVAYYAGHIDDDDEFIFYCDQCAALLIKQGFKVTKLTEPER